MDKAIANTPAHRHESLGGGTDDKGADHGAQAQHAAQRKAGERKEQIHCDPDRAEGLAQLVAEHDPHQIIGAGAGFGADHNGHAEGQNHTAQNQRRQPYRQGEDYLITYSDEAQLPDRFFMAGSVLVKTNGTKVLNQSSYSAPWTVEMQDLKVFAYTNTGLRQTFNFDEGETTLYFDGADSYIIGASSFRIHLDNVDASSNWTGRYTLRAEDSSLAYSLCSGKDFKVEGGASGPTLYSSDMTQAVGMGYELINGVYRGMQIISGTQECRFLSPLEYDTTQFPASSVTYEWSYDSSTNTVFQKIRYNGYVYPKD